MEIQVINSEKMEALESLAKTNVAVSDARTILTKLKEEESAFLNKREEKALAQVKKIHNESEEVLREAFSNYEEIKKFGSSVADVLAFLLEAQNDFQALQTKFEEYTNVWKKNIDDAEKQLNNIKKQLKTDQTQLKNDQTALEKAQLRITEDKIKLVDERETLDRAITRLKEGKI